MGPVPFGGATEMLTKFEGILEMMEPPKKSEAAN
jgi:hypothetical protein